jgi:[ribosomal protein S18]-alanine N-acetyltransferase
MRIRGYSKGDVEAMFLLDLACFAAPYQFDREMMQEVAEAANAIVVVIEDDDGMLGFVIAHIQGKGSRRHAYIVTIDVAPSVRHQGIGARLLQQTEAQAAATRVHSIGLHVAVDNAAAIAFYQHQGYEQIGTEKNFYREAGTDALVYVKQL